MSAAGFITFDKGCILLSDGIAIRVSGIDPKSDYVITPDRIKTTTMKKVFKFNDRVGMIWLGSYGPGAKDFKPAASKPKDIANELMTALENSINADFYNDSWFSMNISILGYESGQLEYFHIATVNGRLKLDKPSIIPPGEFGASQVGIGREESTEIFKRNLKIYQQPIPAFRAFCKDTAMKGVPESEIFFETLNPQ